MFNACFERTEPMNEIMAWGSMAQVMSAACFDGAWEEMLDMEAVGDEEEDGDGEEVEDAEPGEMTVLKRLLESDGFDEQDEEHLELARVFFESVMVG